MVTRRWEADAVGVDGAMTRADSAIYGQIGLARAELEQLK